MDGLSEITLEDFSSVCRICLNKEDLVALNHKHLNIMKKIIKIEMEIDDEDLFPSNICKRCTAKLEDISSFIMLSESSHALFKQLLQDSKPDLALVKLEEVPEIGNFSESEPEGAEEIRNVLEKKDSQPLKKSNCRKWLPTICKICSQSFSSKKKFIAHTRVNPKCVVKDHKCNVCDKSFLTEFKLKYHMRSHSDETPFKCKICSKTFRYAPNLRRHDNIIHKGMKPFKCEVCGKDFATSLRLTEHSRIHTGERPLICNYCGMTFKKYSTRHAHVIRHKITNGELHHSKKKSNVMKINNSPGDWSCEICSKKMSSKQTLSKHMQVHGEKAFLCTKCGKRFFLKSSLEIHFRIHTGEKPYKCNDCGNTFRHIATYYNHLRMHKGQKTFECNSCGKMFLQLGHLQSHIRTHTGEKPYKCKFCEKCFAQNGNLKTHLKIHCGDRSFHCKSCSLSFLDATSLKKHQKKHENKINK